MVNPDESEGIQPLVPSQPSHGSTDERRSRRLPRPEPNVRHDPTHRPPDRESDGHEHIDEYAA
ncbi:MAG: hypothetical protein WCP34_02575 [Pseudomonadota bacterium]